MEPAEQIELLNTKIEWLTKSWEEYDEKKNSFDQHLNAIQGSSTSKEKEAIEIKIFLYDNLEKMFRYRIAEAEAYIQSIRNPSDIYLRTHANTTSSDAICDGLRSNLNTLGRTKCNVIDSVSKEILSAKDELLNIINEDNYKLS